MLLHNTQENDNNFLNMEFHTTFKKQIIIVLIEIILPDVNRTNK